MKPLTRTSIVCTAFLLHAALHAEVDVCSLTTDGLINNQTWTAANSPYIVRCDLFVAGLTIEPGVEVLVDGPWVIQVLSTINADGTAEAPISFTAFDPTVRWVGLWFHDTPGGSTLTNCVFEYANNNAVRIVDAVPPVIAGCTFQSNTTPGTGGAINVARLIGDLHISDCDFTGNSSGSHGGALRLNLETGFTASVLDCSFTGNTANPTNAAGDFVGGAAWIETGDATFVGCRFAGNRCNARCTFDDCTTIGRGGAVYMGSAGALRIEASEFDTNRVHSQSENRLSCLGGVSSHGGAVYIARGTVALANLVLAGNTITTSGCGASRQGSGVLVNGGDVDVINCSIARNTNAPGLHRAGGTLDVTNSIIFFNNDSGAQISGTVGVTWSCVEGGYPGEGNIRFNPVFAGPDAEAADLRIRPGSPCIDAGDPLPQFDDVCFPPSLGTLRNDMGAHGGPGACDLASFDCNDNLIDDRQELSGAPGRDCNANGVLDECDIDAGVLTDSNADSVPDECAERSLRLEPRDGAGPICWDVVLSVDRAAFGGEISIGLDPAVLEVLEVTEGLVPVGHFVTEPAAFPADPLLVCPGGSTAGLRIFWAVPDGGDPLVPGEHVVARLCVAYREGAPPGRCSPIAFVDCLDAPGTPARNIFTDANGDSQTLFSTGVTLCPETFRRGDANADGFFDASDPIVILTCLFTGMPCPRCDDAADANDDGEVDIADAQYLINWRFLDGPPPGAPFPGCDRDPNPDALPSCGASSCP